MKYNYQSPELLIDKTKNTQQASSNCIYVGTQTYRDFLQANVGKEPIYIQLCDYVFILKEERSVADTSVAIPGVIRSALKLSPTMDKPILYLYDPPKQLFLLSTLKFGVSTPTMKTDEPQKVIDEQTFINYFRSSFKSHFIGSGQEFFYNIDGIDLVIKVKEHEFIDEKTNLHFGTLFEETNLEFKSNSVTLKIKSASMKENHIFSKKFKFEDIGVGGLDKEIIQMFRRAFSTRRLPPSVLEKYGGSHVKGVLLFGPPGTGKTLIAKELAKCLNSVKPKVVNGPEVLSKYVGESEENVRKLFAEAKKDQVNLGDDSPLHVIIFDEFDAIAKPRGMDSDSTGVASNVVNQLLSMIDGVESLNNILLIGMTNRKDLIDPAIIRPGRFEVHIEVGLPNEDGRVQIFNIHTKKMRENALLGPDVDISKLAHMTKNYTGAEIESVVKSAKTFSLNRNHDLLDFSKELKFTKDNMIVSMQDFTMAVDEVTSVLTFR